MNNQKIKTWSNKSFGLVFFIVFLIIGLYPLLDNYNPRIWNQIEYYSDGKILERVKDGEYLIIKGENVLKEE